MDNVTFYKNIASHLGESGTPTQKWYGMSGAWCCMFVTKNFSETGNKSLWFGGKKVAYCPTAIQWCKANLAHLPIYLAMPSDICFFDWQPNGTPDHIGFARERVSTTSLKTIEGNTGSPARVREKVRPVKYMMGGVYRPHLAPTTLPTKQTLVIDGQFDYASIYMLQIALGLKADAIFGRDTLKALQKKAGVTADADWGTGTSKAIQKMCGLTGSAVDGEFGINSVKALQKWINKQNEGVGPEEEEEEEPITPVEPQPYTGDVPNWVNLSAQIVTHEAKRLAYPAGTKASKYTWNKKRTTSAVAAFVTAINNVYPKRSGWSKQCQDGASCDVFVGTVMRSCGAFNNMPRGLSEQIPYLAKQSIIKNMGIKSTANFQAGDIGIYIGKTKGAHIWINVSGKTVAEASHTLKYFGHLKARKYTSSNKKTWKCYRFVKPIRSYVKKGDVGSEIIKVQKMLNWAIDAGLATDGDAGDKTHEAIIKFQSTYGLTQDGFFGQDCVNKVLELKK